MTTYRSILTPLDGSPFSEHALPMACEIALRANALLRLVHVHALSASPIAVEGSPVLDENMHSLYLEHERLYLEQIKKQLLTRMPELRIEVEAYDRPSESLVNESVGIFLARRIVERDDVDLIVMTTHGHGGLTRFWLGSLADVLVRMSQIPLLLLRPTDQAIDYAQRPILKKILIPLDNSSLAEEVLPPALAVGDLMQATYTLLRVIQPVNVTSFNLNPQLLPLEMETQRAMETQATHYLHSVTQRLQNAERKFVTQVLCDPNPASTILEEAQNQAVDLIALATHARSGWARFTLGRSGGSQQHGL